MHNCIGFYDYQIRRGYSQIFGVKTAGSDRACDWGIDVHDRRIVQFRGLCNVEAPEELQRVVRDVLERANLIDCLAIERAA